jgi:nucleotide-binding universal stress UspA family protein
MYNHILVGYDSTEESHKALDSAIDFAKMNPELTLTVAHVYTRDSSWETATIDSPLNSRVVTSPGLDNTYVGRVEPEHEYVSDSRFDRHAENDELMEKARHHLEGKGVHARFELLDGPTASSLVHYAKEHRVDLIVVGQTHREGLQKWFTSSVSKEVLKEAPSHVLIVK